MSITAFNKLKNIFLRSWKSLVYSPTKLILVPIKKKKEYETELMNYWFDPYVLYYTAIIPIAKTII